MAAAVAGLGGGRRWPMGVVFVIAPHQLGLPRAGERELTWTPLQQVVGSTYVWFTMLLFVLLWLAWRKRRPATEPADARS